jgi:hypothetical protein
MSDFESSRVLCRFSQWRYGGVFSFAKFCGFRVIVDRRVMNYGQLSTNLRLTVGHLPWQALIFFSFFHLGSACAILHRFRVAGFYTNPSPLYCLDNLRLAEEQEMIPLRVLRL